MRQNYKDLIKTLGYSHSVQNLTTTMQISMMPSNNVQIIVDSISVITLKNIFVWGSLQ